MAEAQVVDDKVVGGAAIIISTFDSWQAVGGWPLPTQSGDFDDLWVWRRPVGEFV